MGMADLPQARTVAGEKQAIPRPLWHVMLAVLLLVPVAYGLAWSAGWMTYPVATVFGVALGMALLAVMMPRRGTVDDRGAVHQPSIAAPPSTPSEPVPASGSPDLVSLMEGVPEPIAVIDAGKTIHHVNSAFVAAFGTVATGTSATVRFRAPDVHNAIGSAVERRTPHVADYADRGPIERWYRVTATPILTQGNQPGPALLHFSDLSETRRLARMRSDFVGNASHELRTPLASLKGYLETLAGPARDDAAARDRFIPIMLEQADRMERLIDDLLSLSRFETGSGRGTFLPVQIVDVMHHVRGALRPLADAREAELHVDMDAVAASATSVLGNRDELIQLFDNLVENAIKYGRRGGRVQIVLQGDVQLSGRPAIRITVIDDGPGIAPEHLPRLVERFYRVDVQTSRDMQGTGLGLAIVKHIIARHEGSLDIRSTLGSGSQFSVTLPVTDVNQFQQDRK